MTTLEAGGTLADRFRLVRPLGNGSLGDVWLAQDEHADGRRVALKILKPQWARHAGALELLRRELQKQRRLSHPNVLAAHELVQSPEATFLVMQAAPSGDLTTLRRAPLPRLLSLLAQIADALAHAHEQGIVHRDLKPANVLLDDDGRPLLADFGVAVALDEAGLSVAGGGTREAMSPEQHAGADPSPADDLFAFGVLCHRLLAGQAPWGDDPDAAALRTPAPSLGDVARQPLPEELVALVDSLLCRLPAQRPADARTVAARLRAMGAAPKRTASAKPIVVEEPEGEDSLAIAPVARRARGAPGADSTAELTATRPLLRAVLTMTTLLVLALGTGFWLWQWQPERVAMSGPQAPEEEAPLAREPEEDRLALRREAEDLLVEVGEKQRQLERMQARRWAEGEWQQALALAQQGDDLLLAREYRQARDALAQALAALVAIDQRRPEVYQVRMRDGAEALSQGEAARARAAFEDALHVQPEDEPALEGLGRAERLEDVLAAMTEGEYLEADGALARAAEAYQRAIALDSQWSPAAEALQRVRRLQQEQAFRGVLAQGLTAMADENYQDAIRIFTEALEQRPASREAQEGLRQAEDGRRLQQIRLAQARATAFERQERWEDAITQYREALQVDSTLSFARVGLIRAEARASLDVKLENLIGNPSQLFDDAVLDQSRELLEEAEAVAAGAEGPRLHGQVQRLSRIIDLASTPLPVELRSDGRTEVSVFRVGQLGRLQETTLELRPGNYVAVGSRNGYRDVRVAFQVRPGMIPEPIRIVCDDPI